MLVFLAPVPVIHLPSALDVGRISSKVAFATEKALWFLDPKTGPSEGTEVFILASKTGLEPGMTPPFKVGFAVLRGTFVGFVGAVAGRHPDRTTRPVSTATDFAVSGFFEVTGLNAIAPIPLTTFLTKSGMPIRPPVLGPTLVRVGELPSL